MTAQEQVPLIVNFELEPGADTKLLSQQIASWLEKEKAVAESEVEAEPARSLGPVEIAQIIAAGVVVIKAAGSGVEEVTRLLRAIKGLVAELRGIKAVRVAGDKAAQDITKLPDGQLAAVAESVRGS